MLDIFARTADPAAARAHLCNRARYLSLGESGPRGCFTVMTAASEAVADPDIRAMVLEGFVELDKAFAACFRQRRKRANCPRAPIRRAGATGLGHHPHHRHPRARARAAQELEAIVSGAIDVIVGKK